MNDNRQLSIVNCHVYAQWRIVVNLHLHFGFTLTRTDLRRFDNAARWPNWLAGEPQRQPGHAQCGVCRAGAGLALCAACRSTRAGSAHCERRSVACVRWDSAAPMSPCPTSRRSCRAGSTDAGSTRNWRGQHDPACLRMARCLATIPMLAGFIADLATMASSRPGRHALVLGAGGSARAIVYGLAEAGARAITVLNRTLDRAEALVRRMAACVSRMPHGGKALIRPRWTRPPAQGRSDRQLHVAGHDAARRRAALGCRRARLRRDQVVYDLVYNPWQTRLLQLAEDSRRTGHRRALAC